MQELFIIAIVTTCAVYIGRKLYRTFRRAADPNAAPPCSCSCSGCQSDCKPDTQD